MVCFTREEVANKLVDFYNLITEMYKYPNSKLGLLFVNMHYQRAQNNPKYDFSNENYSVMIRVHQIINILRIFSYCEETSIESINNDDLDFSSLRKNVKDGGIFVEGNGNNFSNKQIVKFIRDAFRHNDDPNHSKFNISRNGKYVEFHLLDARDDKEKLARPNDKKPFHIKMTTSTLNDIYLKTMDNILSPYFCFFINDNNSQVDFRYYFRNISIERFKMPKKLPKSVKEEIMRITESEDSKKNKLSKIEDVLKNNNINYTKESMKLSEDQKEALESVKNLFLSSIPFESRTFFMDLFIRNYLPIGIEKAYDISSNILFHHLLKPDNTYYDVLNSVCKIVRNDELNLNSSEQKIRDALDDEVSKAAFLISFQSITINNNFALDMLTYMFNTSFANNNLVINDHEGNPISFVYDKPVDSKLSNISFNEHIRNALTHGWFHPVSNGDFMFYDCAEYNKNSHDFYCHARIPLESLINELANNTHIQVKKTMVQI